MVFYTEEMVETLVHEGSHHATAYTDDVEFQGTKVIKKRRFFGKSHLKI